MHLSADSLYPSRAVPPLADFERGADEGRLRRREADGLVVFCYNHRTFYGDTEVGWDNVALNARGTVFKEATGELVALSFPKFFNLGERPETELAALPIDEELRVTTKLDGSMIVVFHDGDRWRTTTKGSLTSPQSVWAADWIERELGWRTFEGLEELTLVFEAIYPQGTFPDDLVVDYGDREDLVLLTAYHTDRRAELVLTARDHLAEALGVDRPAVHVFEDVVDVRVDADDLPASREGYVIEFTGSGRRVKVKGTAYFRAAKILQGEVRLTLWEALTEDGRVDPELLEAVPATHRDDLLSEARRIEGYYRRLHDRAESLGQQARSMGAPEREVARWIQSLEGPLTPAVFAAWRGKHRQLHDVIRKTLRPTGGSWDEDLVSWLDGLGDAPAA